MPEEKPRPMVIVSVDAVEPWSGPRDWNTKFNTGNGALNVSLLNERYARHGLKIEDCGYGLKLTCRDDPYHVCLPWAMIKTVVYMDAVEFQKRLDKQQQQRGGK